MDGHSWITGLSWIPMVVVGALRFLLELGRAAMGRLVVRASRSPTCDIRVNEYGFKSAPKYALEVTVHPGRLEIKNAERYQYRFNGLAMRTDVARGWGFPQPWRSGQRYIREDGPIICMMEDLDASLVQEGDFQATSCWAIEVWIEAGSKKSCLYKGHPTSVTMKEELV